MNSAGGLVRRKGDRVKRSIPNPKSAKQYNRKARKGWATYR